MEKRKNRQGMSLVELLVALAILGIALVPLLSLFVQALKSGEHSNRRTIALNLVRDLQEEIRSKAFMEPDPPTLATGVSPYFPNGTSISFGCEECTSATFVDGTDKRNTKFDDIDDYDGWCEGKDCNTSKAPCSTNAAAWGLCGTHPVLQAYNGEKYEGAGFPHYQGFTRAVEVFNIWNNMSTVVQAGEVRTGWDPKRHNMYLGVGTDYRKSKPFNFFNLSDVAIQSTAAGGPRTYPKAQKHLTRLKVIKVTVTYVGQMTPDIKVEDLALMPMPVSKETIE